MVFTPGIRCNCNYDGRGLWVTKEGGVQYKLQCSYRIQIAIRKALIIGITIVPNPVRHSLRGKRKGP